MSFLLPLALLLGLTVAFPIFAHALRKGRAQTLDFPAARLVPEQKSSAQQRHRIQDRLLLLLRIAMLVCLTLLAASPFVRCSRLALSRTDGASVAAALVIDDSASMRALLPNGKTRLEAALAGADQLLDTARAGDSFSIVLAGYPARVLTPSTTELGSVRDALLEVKPTDRRTDLDSALRLARSLQEDVPQSDRPIVLLSDLSHRDPLDLSGVVLPDAGLRDPLENCALLAAVRINDAVQVEMACTSADSLRNRKIRLETPDGATVAADKEAEDGVVRIPLLNKSKKNSPPRIVARLTPPKTPNLDQISADDHVDVLENSTALTIAVRADQGKAGHKTGSGTVVQAAIESLDRGTRVQTLSLLPDNENDLEPYGALFIDDPSGLTPEVSEAIATWAQRGGVGVLLLGPSIASTPLGSTFSPFVDGPVTWARTTSKGADAKTPGSLGPLTTTWDDLGTDYRATFTVDEGATTRVRWDDGSPLVVERTPGRGLLLTVALPASVDQSDLALRPAFLELMDYVVTQSAIRRGAQATPVGQRWNVDESTIVRGPEGQVLPHRRVEGVTSSSYVEPHLAGRYTISTNEDRPEEAHATRVAMLDRAEQVSQPNEKLQAGAGREQQAALTKVGISREIALLALILGALELTFRALKRARGGRHLPNALSSP